MKFDGSYQNDDFGNYIIRVGQPSLGQKWPLLTF